MEQFKIRYRKYGIADRFPNNVIELNKNLDKYPRLKRAILQHEAKHTRNQKFNKDDFLHDLTTVDQFPQMEMIKFILRHPLAMVQFLPIYWTKRYGWIYDLNMIVIWCIGLILLGITLSWALTI